MNELDCIQKQKIKNNKKIIRFRRKLNSVIECCCSEKGQIRNNEQFLEIRKVNSLKKRIIFKSKKSGFIKNVIFDWGTLTACEIWIISEKRKIQN